MTRLQETHEAVLQQKDAQHTSAIQRLTTQLREKDVRLRERDVWLREMEESHRQLVTQLQQKDVELEQKNADISRLHLFVQGQVQRNADISGQAHVPVCYTTH